MASKGGKRAGAGRKPSDATVVAHALRNAIARRVAVRAWKYMNALEDLALGYYREDPVSGRIYKTPPDREAIRDVFDRFMGKPAQNIEGLGAEESAGAPVFVIMRGGQEIAVGGEQPSDDRTEYETKRLEQIKFAGDEPLETKVEVIEQKTDYDQNV